MMEWFIKFPALWGAAGLIVGGVITAVIAVFIFRKYGDALTGASDKLVGIQEKQLASMERAMQLQQEQSTSSLKMQKDHYDAELAETRRKAAEDLDTMMKERNTYRQTLHDERGELGSQLEHARVKIAELEARPDLTSLLEFETKSDERREGFYKNLGSTMERVSKLLEGVAEALHEHDRKTVERMSAFIAPVLEAMKEVIESCDAMRKNSRGRKRIIERAEAKLKNVAAAAPQET